MDRRKSREKAVQLLFQMDLARVDLDYALGHQVEEEDEGENSFGEEENRFFLELVRGTVQHLTDIDTLIRENLRGWTFERLAGVDRAIIRLATFEMHFRKVPPPIGVCLNEAIELGKLYGTDESPKFINGVLSGLVKESGKQQEME